MNHKQNTLAAFIGFIASTMMLASVPLTPAQAGMITTAQEVQFNQGTMSADSVQKFMAREDVRSQMQAMGVSPEATQLRLAALTESELQQLAGHIEEAPAGGGVLGVLGVVLVVLLVLELVGITNIFNFR